MLKEVGKNVSIFYFCKISLKNLILLVFRESKEKSVAASRKNINKVNGKQKEVLAEFMLEHPDLAKNKLQNCAQGKVKSQTLWGN